VFSCQLSQRKPANEGRQLYTAIPGPVDIGSEGPDILQPMAIDVTCMVITGAKQDGVVENLVEDSDLIYEDC